MKKWPWPIVWLVQFVLMAIAGTLVALSDLFGGTVYGLCAFLIMPLLGAVSAYRSTRRGLLNYAAWLAPGLCMAVTHYALYAYLPDPGPVFVCWFISLVGAASGEVMNQRLKEGKRS